MNSPKPESAVFVRDRKSFSDWLGTLTKTGSRNSKSRATVFGISSNVDVEKFQRCSARISSFSKRLSKSSSTEMLKFRLQVKEGDNLFDYVTMTKCKKKERKKVSRATQGLSRETILFVELIEILLFKVKNFNQGGQVVSSFDDF